MPADDETEPETGADGEPVEPVPTLECIVEEDQLSLAIGKRGQNVRLAAALIGARIEIKSEQAVKAEVAQALQRMLLASQRRGTALSEVPGLEAASAAAFEAAGFATVGDLLDAESGVEGKEGDDPLSSVALDKPARDAVLDAAHAFEEAPEEEEAADEGLEFQEVAETEGEKGPEGDPQT
jgi:N utilization substance protein A